jgi:hypothetical protein
LPALLEDFQNIRKRLQHNELARPSPIHPAGLIPFPFACCGHLLIAFFFSVFSFEK